MLKKAYKSGFRWREVDHDVAPTLDAPPGFQLNSFHTDGPVYTPDTDPQYVPTGLNPDAHPPMIHCLPESIPTTAAPLPWSMGAVPALQAVPRFVHRDAPGEREFQREHALTRSRTRKRSEPVSTATTVERSTAGTSSKTPAPVLAPPQLAKPIPPLVIKTSRFTPVGVPGSSQLGVNMVSLFYLVSINLLSLFRNNPIF